MELVSTLRSTQHTRRPYNDAKEGVDEFFLQLTLELREMGRSWTTFFPPKLSELASGGLAGGTGSSESQRFGGSVQITDTSVQQVGANSKTTSKLLFGTSVLGEEQSGGVVPEALPTEDHRTRNIFSTLHVAAEDVVASNRVNRLDSTSNPAVEEEAGPTEHSPGRVSGRREHFTLPTESWAHRSAGWRGFYYAGLGDDGRAERPTSEQWPRKRSTGTTMRLDGRRPDLRHSPEAQRPWTAPGRVLEGVGGAEGGDVRETEPQAKHHPGHFAGRSFKHCLPKRAPG